MGWSYFEYLRQPEWFIVALIRHFKEADQQENERIKTMFGGKK